MKITEKMKQWGKKMNKEKALPWVLVAVGVVGVLAAGLLLAPASAPVSASVAEGDSMGGGAELVVHVDGEASVGDPVVLDAGNQLIYHRVVEETSEGLVTQGDAEPVADQYVEPSPAPYGTAETILGVGVASVPLVGAVGGLLAVLAVLGLGTASMYRRQLGAGLRRDYGSLSTARQSMQLPTRQTLALVFTLLMVGFAFAPFAGGFGGIAPQDHDGVASAEEPDDMTFIDAYTEPTGIADSLDVAPDGHLYAGSDEVIHKVDTSDMSQDFVYTEHTNSIYDVHKGNDGHLYSGGLDEVVHKIDPSDMNKLDEYDFGGENVGTITMGPDGYLYVGGMAGSIHKIDPSDMTQVDQHSGIDNQILDMDITSDGTLYVSSIESDAEVRQIDTSDMSKVDTYLGHTDAPDVIEAPGDGYVYSGDQDGEVHKLDTSGLNQVAVYQAFHEEHRVSGLAMHDDGYLYASERGSVTTDDEIQRIDPEDMSQVGDPYNPQESTSYNLEMGPDGNLYSTFRTDGESEVYKIDSGTELGPPVSGTVTDADGNAIESATVSSPDSDVESVTTDSAGGYELTVPEEGSYEVEADARGYESESRSVDVPEGGLEGVDFELPEGDAPFVMDYSPGDGEMLEVSDVTVDVQVGQHDGDAIDVDFYHRTGDDDFELVGSVAEASDGEVVSFDVLGVSGESEWYVRLDAGSGSVASEVRSFRSPGGVVMYDLETGNVLDDREIAVEVESEAGVTELSTMDGSVSFDGVDPAGKWTVEIDAPDYELHNFSFFDYEHEWSVYLTGGEYEGHYYQETFALDDETGEYPASETTVALEYFDGIEWVRQDADVFGAENRANITVTEGEEYRIKIENWNGDQRVVGEYSATEPRDGVVTVTVPSIENVAEEEEWSESNQWVADEWESESDYSYPPVARSSASPNDPIVGESVTFSASDSYDMDGEVVSYEWEFSDGSTATGEEVTRSFSESGSVSATVTVEDDAGLTATSSIGVYVAPEAEERRAPPSASISVAPGDPDVGDDVALNASAETAGEIESVAWDVTGDGETDVMGADATYQFESPGLHQVCATVEDDAGATDTVCSSVVVYDPFPPGDGESAGSGGFGGAGPIDSGGGGSSSILVGAGLVGVALLGLRRAGALSGVSRSLSGVLRRFRR